MFGVLIFVFILLFIALCYAMIRLGQARGDARADAADQSLRNINEVKNAQDAAAANPAEFDRVRDKYTRR